MRSVIAIALVLGAACGGDSPDAEGSRATPEDAPASAADPGSPVSMPDFATSPAAVDTPDADTAAPAPSGPGEGCDPSYPDFCIPPPPPDLDCGDVEGPKPFRVRRPDPHKFDRDGDGRACEPNPRRRR